MAGRIRTIKPEINEDATTAQLSDRAWRLFVSTWLVADDYGNLRGEPTYLHGQIFWGAFGTMDDTRAALADLVDRGLLIPYSVRGQVYITIKGWTKHQRVDKPGKPRCPGADDPEAKPFHWLSSNSRESPGSLVPDLRPPTSDPDHDPDQRTSPAAPVARVSDEDLLGVYQDYPLREGKTKGLKKLKTQIRTLEHLEALKGALANYKASRKVREGFVKHFDTWAGCWRDYLEPERDDPTREVGGQRNRTAEDLYQRALRLESEGK